MDAMKKPEYADVASPEAVTDTDQRPIAVNVSQPGSLTKLPPGTETTEKWRQIGEQISAFLSELPDYVNEFFSEYQRPLITVGLVVTAFITVKVTLAILDAINEIPLLAPIFELVGIGYSAWFVYRYLLQASSRKELSDEFNSMKSRVLGQGTPKS